MARFLVLGDLHGRILPAFALAARFSREHGVALDGLLQVGDLGYFPRNGCLDRATLRHARGDALELGASLVYEPSPEADQVLGDEAAPPGMWFTAGNHEDFELLAELSTGPLAGQSEFAVDAYQRVMAIRDGAVATVAGVRVGAVWGIDDQASGARRDTPNEAVIKARSVNRLSGERFDVLLSHDSPHGAVRPGCGSERLSSLLTQARPAFAFFGHYAGEGRRVHVPGETRVYHLSGLSLRRDRCRAEARSAGLLTIERGKGTFDYLDPRWLGTVTRQSLGFA